MIGTSAIEGGMALGTEDVGFTRSDKGWLGGGRGGLALVALATSFVCFPVPA
jgi:hypothetical protein